MGALPHQKLGLEDPDVSPPPLPTSNSILLLPQLLSFRLELQYYCIPLSPSVHSHDVNLQNPLRNTCGCQSLSAFRRQSWWQLVGKSRKERMRDHHEAPSSSYTPSSPLLKSFGHRSLHLPSTPLVQLQYASLPSSFGFRHSAFGTNAPFGEEGKHPASSEQCDWWVGAAIGGYLSMGRPGGNTDGSRLSISNISSNPSTPVASTTSPTLSMRLLAFRQASGKT